MRYIFYYCRIALHFVREHLLSCMSQNQNTAQEVAREDSSTMFSETLESLEATKEDDPNDMPDSVQDEQLKELMAEYEKDLDCISKSSTVPSISASTDAIQNQTGSEVINAEHGPRVEASAIQDDQPFSFVSTLLDDSRYPLLNISEESDTADDDDLNDSSDEDDNFQKQKEEQDRANQLELEAKKQQRIDKQVNFQNQAKEEQRLLLEELRKTGSNSK
ncbi:hypothetical protein B9Z55_016804 [Caenorhabditis nigoni]|nr:hypothetical protein B9Z55_016804 [Caenorhabditis nigoni]